MSQDSTDSAGRIENASPEYIAFRKEILGSSWNDFENTILLGPFEMSQLDEGQAEHAKYMFGEVKEVDFVLYDSATGERLHIDIPPSILFKSFAYHMDKYAERINQLPQRLKSIYKDVIDEVKGYLTNRYAGITPKKSHFVSWFVSRVPAPIIYMTIIRDLEKGRSRKTFGFRRSPEIFLTPESVERSLHEYCHWKKSQQDAIHSEVVGSSIDEVNTKVDELTDDEKLDAVISEYRFRDKNPINNVPMGRVVDYFMQLTTAKSTDGNSFLTKSQFVDFLRCGFGGDKPVKKIRANCTSNLNHNIVIRLFYLFQNDAGEENLCPKRDKDSYDKHVRLLTDNFEGFSYKSIRPNFNKQIKAKTFWKRLSEYC